MANEQKSVKSNKKYTNRPLWILLIVAIIAVGVMYWITHKDTKEKVTTSSSSTTTQTEEEPKMQSLIDLTKTDNAQIVDGEKENTSAELAKERTFEGMTIKNIKLKSNEGITQFTATVENNSGSDYAGGKLVIVFTNQDGSEYARLNSVLPAIKNGETNSINAGTTADIGNAYNFTIEVAK